jgi:hypothetical protein
MPCCKYYGVFWETSIQSQDEWRGVATKFPFIYYPLVEENDTGTQCNPETAIIWTPISISMPGMR